MDASVVIHFVIAGEPMSKARARVVNGHAYTPERTRVAEAGVQAAFLAVAPDHQPRPIIEGARYGVTATFLHRTRQRRDIDNMLKLILDGLNGYAWQDDTQVTEIAARKTLVPKGEERTEVTIYELGADIGLSAQCRHCGKDFRTYPSLVDKVRYCSAKCREDRLTALATRTCETCGDTFTGALRKFCSTNCQRQGTHVVQPCAHCGTDVDRFKSWSKNGRPFCGDECRATYWREHRAAAARGVCSSCGGHTSKKTYTRCRACIVGGAA